MRKILSKLNLMAILCLSLSFISQSVFAQAEGWQELNEKTLELLRKGDYAAAITSATMAHESAVKEYGYKHHNYIASLHNVAIAYTKLANYDQAHYLFHNALQTSKKTFGESHVVYAISAYRMGDLLQIIGQKDEALQLYNRALPIIKKREGTNSFHYTTAIAQLAKLHLKMGEALKAEESLIKSNTYVTECEECTAADLAENFHLLADTYANMGRKNEATELYKKVVFMRADAQGKTHPEYAQTLHDYGLHISSKNKAEAISLLQNALSIKALTLGLEHPAYAKCSDDLKQLNGEMEKTSMSE